jgi:hypothetical protein
LAQLQAEMSDFEAAEQVFNAILQQIRMAELPEEA